MYEEQHSRSKKEYSTLNYAVRLLEKIVLSEITKRDKGFIEGKIFRDQDL